MSPCFSIELKVGVPYESDFLCKSLDSLDDEFVLVKFVIDVNYDILDEFNILVCPSSCPSVCESLMVNYTKVRYIFEDPKVDDTCIQVTINRSLLYLLHMIAVLLFLEYKTCRWILSFLGIIFSTFFYPIRYIPKLAYRFRMPLYYDAFELVVIQIFHKVEHVGLWCVSHSYLHFTPL